MKVKMTLFGNYKVTGWKEEKKSFRDIFDQCGLTLDDGDTWKLKKSVFGYKIVFDDFKIYLR